MGVFVWLFDTEKEKSIPEKILLEGADEQK